MRPFRHVLERRVNENMHEPEHEHDGKPGPALPEAEDAEVDLKKGYPSPELENDDEDRREKKDHPPRFSTLFGDASCPAPLPTPAAVREYQREYYPRAQRKSGVFMPMPLFIIFAVILFFETTILFAYTVIGLYNNAPSRIFPWAGPGTAAPACNCEEKQSGINFAPNFIMPGQAPQARPITEMVTITADPAQLSSTSTSTSSTTTTTTSSTTLTTSTEDMASMASAIASIIEGFRTTGTTTTATTDSSTSSPPPTGVPIMTTTVPAPPQSTTTVLTILSVDEHGNPITPTGSESTTSPTSTTSSSSATTTTTTTTTTTSTSTDTSTSQNPVAQAIEGVSSLVQSLSASATRTTLVASTTPAS